VRTILFFNYSLILIFILIATLSHANEANRFPTDKNDISLSDRNKLNNAFKQFIPQANSISIEPFMSGLSRIRKLFLCTVHEKKYIAVLLTGDFDKRKNEVETHKAVMQKGISPHIYYYDADYSIVIMDFLVGNTITIDQANQVWVVEQIAHALRETQKIKIDVPQKDIFDQIRTVYKKLIQKQTALSPQFEQIMEKVEIMEQKVIAFGQSFVLSHNDLLPGNVMVNKDRVSIIDWEEVGLYNSFLDVAKFSIFLCLKPGADYNLLSQYLKRTPTEQDVEYFRVIKQVARASHALILFNYVGDSCKELSQKQLDIKSYEHYESIFAEDKKPKSPQFFFEMAASLMREFFENESRGCCESYLCEQDFDAKIFEYVRHTKTSSLVHIFPVVQGREDAVRDIIKRYGTVVYEKSIHFYDYGPLHFLKALAGFELLAQSSDFLEQRVKLLFPAQLPLKIFLFECDSQEIKSAISDELHRLFNQNANAFYITADHKDTIASAQILFNKNSIKLINNLKPTFFSQFEKCLKEYKQWLQENNIDNEMFCINGLGILSAQGIKDCSKLTFLHHGYNKEVAAINSDLFAPDNKSGLMLSEIDEFLFDPALHFYYQGIKFAIV
jgi:thiamine kinase-like enzyme